MNALSDFSILPLITITSYPANAINAIKEIPIIFNHRSMPSPRLFKTSCLKS
ncbi:hypothetical protein BAZSYMA_ACONTIG236947_1 [Bathymodiolus azoricus thioautotrophic gill symbiont]|uniref:Uncharacterized protein n=1 Tax=Bathymodiolus azoricus thioautotrophic gill symbiont TaxID=235205 RepID=A0A1H6MEX2_9GAMM|nr:hypothetical protein BAZSYMA_ACONTIG236947_1 [Bathymodiolus azoricus thioautotrophic gill symbiont]